MQSSSSKYKLCEDATRVARSLIRGTQLLSPDCVAISFPGNPENIF
jgi:hypothetical protein